MQTPSIAKACLIPVCNNKKFSLVHKFPADKERFEEWIRAIQRESPIEKLTGLLPEQIRKRYFVCSRHFSPKEYKNIESRSLNLTAVPHLNFKNLDEIHLSKAGQLQESPQNKHGDQLKSEDCNTRLTKVEPKSSPQFMRILNSTALKPRLTAEDESLKQDLVEAELILEPPTKRIKRTSLKSTAITKTPPVKIREESVVQSSAPSISNSDNNTKAATKLLALMEVTPDQYERLCKSLTSSERDENASRLISFLDNDDPCSTDNELILSLEDNTILNLDLFWLRDHCRCQTCYDSSNHQRKIHILDIPDDIKIKKHELTGENLNVTWEDNHESTYEVKFLVENQPNEKRLSKEHLLWDKKSIIDPMERNCRVSMRDYMSDPEVSKKVLESLHVYGVAFIEGVQANQQNTEFVIRQLFPIHKTFFGEMWTFSDKQDHSDTAYTNIYLGAHNDNTYFNDPAGLQILHCITQSESGGQNFLVDGFQVAEKIKNEHPEVFKRLTTTIITAEYIEDGRHHKHSSPIINLHPITGEVAQIRFNLNDRAPLKTVPAKKIRQLYSDLKILSREFENDENRILFMLRPGTVMIFDNWRVLHGRMSYTGKRTMTGCYVSRTEFQSALRVNGFIE